MVERTLRDQLVSLTQTGIRVFPIHGIGENGLCTCSRGSNCQTPGKHPIWANWVARATDSDAKISNWLDTYTGHNWAALTGRLSGVIVVDIDPRNGGDRSWAQLLEEHGDDSIPRTLVATTGSGGKHIYFRRAANVHSHAIAQGIDVKGEDSLVVIPTSRHKSGGVYSWDLGPDQITRLPLSPPWLQELIEDSQPGRSDWAPLSGPIPSGERNSTIFHHALVMLQGGSTVELVRASIAAASATGAFDGDGLPQEEVEQIIENAASYAQRHRQSGAGPIDQTLNDAGNALRFARSHKDSVLYAVGMGQWLVWNSQYWKPDPDDLQVLRLAVQTAQRIAEEAANAEDRKAQNAVLRWSSQSQNSGRLSSMISLARAHRDLQVSPDKLDQHPWLLATPNGVIDLRTGELHPADPELLISRSTTIAYDPDATCPEWMRTLDLAFQGNEALISYMQRAIGYTITGHTSEQCLFICYGEQGNNGKSTMLEAIHRLMGEYSVMSDFSVLAAANANNSFVTSNLADMRAARFVSINEAKTQQIDETLVKQLTGGDTILARRLYHEPFRFTPQFKLWIRANDIPIISGTDNAIWRRLRLIPFLAEIPPSERKPRHEVDAALDKEAAGILAWAVKGAVQWHEQGLADPDEVLTATAVYREEMDIFKRFLSECTDTMESAADPVTKAGLYSVYREWIRDQGMHPVTHMRFTREMRRKGLQESRAGGVRKWTNVRVKDAFVYLMEV